MTDMVKSRHKSALIHFSSAFHLVFLCFFLNSALPGSPKGEIITAVLLCFRAQRCTPVAHVALACKTRPCNGRTRTCATETNTPVNTAVFVWATGAGLMFQLAAGWELLRRWVTVVETSQRRKPFRIDCNTWNSGICHFFFFLSDFHCTYTRFKVYHILTVNEMIKPSTNLLLL